MMMNIFSVALVGIMAYIWLTRGFFSALLNLMCTLVAGAVAFAAWEPLAYFFLNKMDNTGFIGTPLRGAAWGLSLAAPFAVTLAVLRLLVDYVLVTHNVVIDRVADYIGGLVLGAFSGVITAGIVVLSLGFLRLNSDMFGYQPVSYNNSGSLEKQGGLWVPVDTLTTRLFGHLSENALAVDEPLAKWYPDLENVPGLLRLTDGDGKAFNTIRAADFSVDNRFTVGPAADNNLDTLLDDRWNAGRHAVTDMGGKPFPPGSKLEGFVLTFKAGAKEKNGQVVIGAPQIRLLTHEANTGKAEMLHPISVITQAQSEQVVYTRFRLARNDFVASVGGASDAKMAFEFVVRPGFTPTALYVKNVRVPVSGQPEVEFPDGAARDAAIASKSLITRETFTPSASTTGTRPAQAVNTDPNRRLPEGFDITNSMGYGGMAIQRGSHRNIQIDDNNNIVGGKEVYKPEELKARGLPRGLRVDRFLTTPDTSMVMLDVSMEKPFSLLNPEAQTVPRDSPIRLVDTQGITYDVVGYIYEDDTKVIVRYTPGNPIRSMVDLETDDVMISRTRSGQKLKLIFRPSLGVSIKSFAVGDKVILDIKPPAELKDRLR